MSPRWDELLKHDHEITERMFAAVEQAFDSAAGPSPTQVGRMAQYVRDFVDGCHNQKEEQHLFPRLEARGMPRHGGPLAVMLAEHERARELLARLLPLAEAYAAGRTEALAELRGAFADYATLCKEHFWKENDILYPMAQHLLAPEDAEAVVQGIEAIEAGRGPDTRERYRRLAQQIIDEGELQDLSYGLPREVLAAMLNTLPLELSFIDHEDRVRYFSHEHAPKIFGRTRGAIGMPVDNCHPQKSLHLVRRIIADFKAGARDVAEFWIDMGPRKVHIRYWAVRSPAGAYLGTMESVQDVTSIRALEGERRLLAEP